MADRQIFSRLGNTANQAALVNGYNENLDKLEDELLLYVRRDNAIPNHLLANMDANSNRIYNLQDPVDMQDAATKAYVLQVAGMGVNDHIDFNTSTTSTDAVARVKWNDADGTIEVGLKGGQVTLQIGQEQVMRVVNKTGNDLYQNAYKCVRVDGAQGQRPKVALAQANSAAVSAETIGLVTENITSNAEGYVTTSGLVREINTTGSLQGETWADGDILYLSAVSAGQLTKVKPVAPNRTIVVGYVIYAHSNHGKIFVKVDTSYNSETTELVKNAQSGSFMAMWVGTEAEYAAIVTKDPNTLYFTKAP